MMSETKLNETLTTARFFFEQLLRRHPGWLLAHAMVLLHFFLNYQLGLLFSWWLLATLTLTSVNLIPVHLPVPRRRVFALSLLPAAFVGAIGIGLTLAQTQSRGIGSGTEMDLRSSPVSIVPHNSGGGQEWRLSVPAHLWRIGWGKPPVSHLPAGDVEPESFSILGPLHAYNPYSASSADGVELGGYQLSRALEACCNLQLSPEQARTHLGLAQQGGLDTIYEAARRVQTTPLPLIALEFWVTAAVLFLTLLTLMNAEGERRRPLRRVLRVSAVVVMALLYIGFVAGRTHTHLVSSEVWLPLLVVRAAMAQTASVGTALPWMCGILGLLLLTVLYHRARHRYEKLELPRVSGR